MNAQNIENTEPGHIISCPQSVDSAVRADSQHAPAAPTSTAAVPPTENIPRVREISEKSKIDTPEDVRFRAGSLLARLSSEQRTQLFKWLLGYSVADVVNFVAAPPPQGFGIQTHKTTLRRIKGLIRGHDASVAFETSSSAAEYVSETIRENRPQFPPVISELLLQKAFDLASDQRQSHELKDLIGSAIKLRELDLKVQRLQLLQEKTASTPNRRRVHIKSSAPLPEKTRET